ncbi:MAG: cytochrome c3 family protein [Chitinivibrionales bacterium]|nr:cytochrome c3 family protein [Chitinivibrionales bacterium]
MNTRLFILCLLIFQTASYALCTHCHRDSVYNRVYENSSHGKKSVDCFSCHTDPNILANLGKKLTGMVTLSFKKTHLATRTTDENCLRCHAAIGRFNVVAKEALPDKLKDIGLVIDHKRHLELRDSCRACHGHGNFPHDPVFKKINARDPMGCAACHADIAHATPGKYPINYPSEEQCGFCHGKDRKCPSLKKISDVKDKGRCTECHPNQYSI